LKATTLHYPPYEYEINGKPAGLAVEILEEAVKRTGIKGVDIEFFPWKRAVSSTQYGNKEVIFNAGKNKSRQEWGYYSKDTLILQKYYLFTRKGSNIKTNLDFSNFSDKRIAIRNGYLYGSGPFKESITTPDVFKAISLTDSTSQSVRLLLGGRVDMFVGDFFPVMHYIINNDLVHEIELVDNKETGEDLIVLTWPTYFLFSKINVPFNYYASFNMALKTMLDDGSYQEIYEKYNLVYRLPE